MQVNRIILSNSTTMLNIRNIPYGKNQSLVMVRDVTVIYKVEQMRRDFIANISHELRTPLTVLSGYLENLHHFDDDVVLEVVTELADEGTQHSATEKPVNDAAAAQIPATVQAGSVFPTPPPAPTSGWSDTGPTYATALDNLDRRVATLKSGR